MMVSVVVDETHSGVLRQRKSTANDHIGQRVMRPAPQRARSPEHPRGSAGNRVWFTAVV